MKQHKHLVAQIGEITEGERKIVTIEGKSIGVFNIHGTFVAVLNLCPHELAPVCAGQLRGTALPSQPGEYLWGREGEILACPWHGWEFDLTTGQCLTDKRKLRRYEVVEEDGKVFVIMP
jgi:3-phenylpropionate/trans-cinnamate dioxygenase ferredoxin subunit